MDQKTMIGIAVAVVSTLVLILSITTRAKIKKEILREKQDEKNKRNES